MSEDIEHRACFDLPAPGGIIEKHYDFDLKRRPGESFNDFHKRVNAGFADYRKLSNELHENKTSKKNT